MPNPPTVVDSFPIDEVFAGVIRGVQKGIKAAPPVDESMVVDVAVELRAVTISKGGIPIFSPKSTEKTLEIRLATRVRPAAS
jgi:hypothetical protein